MCRVLIRFMRHALAALQLQVCQGRRVQARRERSICLSGQSGLKASQRAFLRSFWFTTNKSSTTTTFTFNEGFSGDLTGGNYAFRAMTMLVFKDQLFINFGAEGGGGGRGGRVCINPAGCAGADNPIYLQYVDLSRWSRMKRIGANNSNVLRNGSYNGASSPYGDPNQSDQVFNALTVMYEHDNDGAGANASQLYVANGGYTNSTLGSARTGNSDGGIMRTITTYSTKTSLPLNCPNDSSGCLTYFEDVTPDGQPKWNTYIWIPVSAEYGGGVGRHHAASRY